MKDEKILSIPGKVFVLGEYAVLQKLPAILAAVPPRFFLSTSRNTPQGSARISMINPKSPLGRLQTYLEKKDDPCSSLPFQFEDPLRGRGGLGASTAQFALAYAAATSDSEKKPAWQTVWNLYQELMADPNSSVYPSGADLVAQWEGGLILFDPMRKKCQKLKPNFGSVQLLVFSATHQLGRKVLTHEHLSWMSKKDFPSSFLFSKLEHKIDDALTAFKKDDFFRLGQMMNEYGDILSEFNLELPITREDRQSFRNLPGVLGVKGTGALQADAILVLVEMNSLQKEDLMEVARKRNLHFLCDGFIPQEGLTWEN